MNLTVGGLAVFCLFCLFWRGGAGRLGLMIAVLAGASIAVVGDFAQGVGQVVIALAPLFNALGSSGAVG